MLNFCCVILLYTRVVLGQTLCLGEQWCTIVDEPEVYEDRDPAQREAEGPKSTQNSLSPPKKRSTVPVLGPYASRIARRSHARVKQRPLQSAVGTLLLHTMEAEKGTAWSLEFGAWSLELGVWSLEFGAWSLELGAWRLEFGVWMEFAMLWGRGGGRGPWAGSCTGQPQRSTGSKGQLIRIMCAIKMSIRCMMAIVVPRDFCLKDG